jgi:hypothetical protein
MKKVTLVSSCSAGPYNSNYLNNAGRLVRKKKKQIGINHTLDSIGHDRQPAGQNYRRSMASNCLGCNRCFSTCDV